MIDPSDPASAALLAQLEGQARRLETPFPEPFGDGRMVWRVWGEPVPGRLPIVLFHGGFGSWRHWVRNVVPLSETRQVFAADLPGLGDSGTPPAGYDGLSIAAIARGGLDAAVPGPFHLACFSFGAAIGGLAAAEMGERVRSFTGVGAAGFGPRERVTEGMIRITPDMPDDETRAAARNNMRILMLSTDEAVDELAVHIQIENTRLARLRSRPISLTTALLDSLPRLSGLVSIIWGAEDMTAEGMLPTRNASILEARPDAQIHVIDGAGHWVQYQAADRVNAILGALD